MMLWSDRPEGKHKKGKASSQHEDSGLLGGRELFCELVQIFNRLRRKGETEYHGQRVMDWHGTALALRGVGSCHHQRFLAQWEMFFFPALKTKNMEGSGYGRQSVFFPDFCCP